MRHFALKTDFPDTTRCGHSLNLQNTANMGETETLSTRRMIAGLVCGSLVGLLCYVILEMGSDLLNQIVAQEFFGFEWRDLQIFETILFFVLFGSPFAIVMGLLIGLPIWRAAEEQPLRSKRSALIYGCVAGGCIGLIFLLLGLAIGLHTFLDEKSSYDSWSYGYQVTKDGLPTALGWLIQLKTLLLYCVAGAVGGLAARAIAVSTLKSASHPISAVQPEACDRQ